MGRWWFQVSNPKLKKMFLKSKLDQIPRFGVIWVFPPQPVMTYYTPDSLTAKAPEGHGGWKTIDAFPFWVSAYFQGRLLLNFGRV